MTVEQARHCVRVRRLRVTARRSEIAQPSRLALKRDTFVSLDDRLTDWRSSTGFAHPLERGDCEHSMNGSLVTGCQSLGARARRTCRRVDRHAALRAASSITTHGRECTRPLRALAVQRPLQTSPITQPPARYIRAPHRRGHAMTAYTALAYSVAR